MLPIRITILCIAFTIMSALRTEAVAQAAAKPDLTCEELSNIGNLNARQIEQVERDCTIKIDKIRRDSAEKDILPIYLSVRGRIRIVRAAETDRTDTRLANAAIQDLDEATSLFSYDIGCQAYPIALRSAAYVLLQNVARANDDVARAELLVQQQSKGPCKSLIEDTKTYISVTRKGLALLTPGNLKCESKENLYNLSARQIEQEERDCTIKIDESRRDPEKRDFWLPTYLSERGRVRLVRAVKEKETRTDTRFANTANAAIQDFDEAISLFSNDLGCQAHPMALRSGAYVLLQNFARARDDIVRAELLVQQQGKGACKLNENTRTLISGLKEELARLDTPGNNRTQGTPSQGRSKGAEESYARQCVEKCVSEQKRCESSGIVDFTRSLSETKRMCASTAHSCRMFCPYYN
jgi:hypothetical protein